jgi:acyl phosphate:glycerol-3-phosphate acyltransferase
VITIFALCLLAYLLGSVPFGLLLTKYAGLGDIRATGSGNIGATNVLRTGNKKLAAATLALDMLKGATVVWVASAFLPVSEGSLGNPLPSAPVYAVALMALMGHIFPLWLNFKGGKGVATAFGILLALAPYAFLITAINWIVMFRERRISSLAALTAFLLVPFWLYIFTDKAGMVFGLVLLGILAYTHRENIKRLRAGTESKFESPQS